MRVDDGFEEGMTIPIHYDPMIAKLIVHGHDRMDAIEKMRRAIHDYEIIGVETTLGFCDYVLTHEAFRSGMFDTHFVKNHFQPSDLVRPLDAEEAAVAGLIGAVVMEGRKGGLGQARESPERQAVRARGGDPERPRGGPQGVRRVPFRKALRRPERGERVPRVLGRLPQGRPGTSLLP